jgi:uncharacterized protein (TIGR03000 family)
LAAVVPSVQAADSASPQESRPAEITLLVPPNAEVWFDGNKTQLTGPERMFRTPPLTPGRDYSYQLRIRWTEGGRSAERQRRVIVHAGDELVVEPTDTRVRVTARSNYFSPANGANVPGGSAVPRRGGTFVLFEDPTVPTSNATPMSQQSKPHRGTIPGSHHHHSMSPGNG